MDIGQLVDQGTGEVFPLGFEPVTIGRHEDNIVVVTDPLVSRHHAEITMQGGRWVIRDLDSANGTVVNGQRITDLQVLNHGDMIQVGRTLFQAQMLAAMARQDTLVERIRPEDVLARQDTLVERIRPEDVLVSQPRRPRVAWGLLALAALAVVVVILIGALVVWPRIQGDGDTAQQEGGTQGTQVAVDATATEIAAAPTDTQRPSKPTETAIPTIAPPSPAPTVAPPTLAPLSPTDTPTAAPVIGFFRADPMVIETGQCTRLEWGHVENATRLTLSGVGVVNPSGRLDVCLDATKRYALRATGPGGTVEKRVRITVRPPAGSIIEYFRVVPSIIAPGSCAQLEWGKVDNATSAIIEPDIGGVGTPGSQEVCPGTTTVYVLTAQNPEGTSSAQANLIVSSDAVPRPVIAFFTANPGSIQAGECITLGWGKVDYATSVTIDHGIGGVATPDSKEVCPGSTTTYVMTAVGPGGTTESQVTVAVSAGRLANLPDLVIESILFAPNPCYRGQKCRVQIKVRNDGPVDAGHFVVRWTPEGAGVVPVEWEMDFLGTGQEKELKYTWIPARIAANLQTVATVDAYGEVEEIRDGDANRLETFVTVLEP